MIFNHNSFEDTIHLIYLYICLWFVAAWLADQQPFAKKGLEGYEGLAAMLAY